MLSRQNGRKRRLLCAVAGLSACAVGGTFLFADTPGATAPRAAMQRFVADISAYAKSAVPGFLVIPQNGDELITEGSTASDPLANVYVDAIDGLGREDLFYGYDEDNIPTPVEATEWMLSFLNRAESIGIEVLAIDYCWDPERMNDSKAQNAAQGFISFAASSRLLDEIPDYPSTPAGVNADDIHDLANARNFLYLINPRQFETKGSLLEALSQTNFDVLIIDLDSEDGPLNRADVAKLKIKANGGNRLVLCYLSIGEAEDYRGYWDPDWSTSPPVWLLDENPNWTGNYPVQFWHSQWQAIVYAMLDDILEAGFDGVYLDRVDVYEVFGD